MSGLIPLENVVEFTEKEKSLPDSFWDLPETLIDSPNIQQMYRAILEEFLRENPERDMAETTLIQRTAALFSYIKHIESTPGIQNTSNYRQLNQLYQTMANDLRKVRTVNWDETKVREEIALEYIQLVNAALSGFDPEVAHTVRRRVAMAMDSTKD